MYTHNPIRTLYSTNGLKVTICPRPTLLGVQLKEGKPSAVKYPDSHYLSKTGYRTFPDIKGINQEDYDRIQPDLVLYELGDGTLLQADRDLFIEPPTASHNATYSYQPCYTHPVNKLTLVEMPEFEEVPVYQF